MALSEHVAQHAAERRRTSRSPPSEAAVDVVLGHVGAVVLERGDQRLGPIVESYYKIYTTNYYFSLYAALLF